MKVYFNIIIVLFFGISITSCDSDDDGNAPQIDRIIGTWQIVEISEFVNENDTVLLDETFSTDACNSSIFFTFTNGGQLTVTEFDYDIISDFDGNLSLDCAVEDTSISGGWELAGGNTYNLTLDGETVQVLVSYANDNETINMIIINLDGGVYRTTFTGNRV
jgi:hypothetical protein